MTDNVVPFRARHPAKPPTEPQPGDERLHRRTRQAAPPARALAAEQSERDRNRYSAAAARQANDKLIATGTPQPFRITMALDLHGLDGPEVDLAVGTFEGNPDGDVDAWEEGRAAPTAEQLALLSELTDFPIAWFYRPDEDGMKTRALICGANGMTEVVSWVDEHGVLQREWSGGDL